MSLIKKIKEERGGGLIGMLIVIVIIAVVFLYMMKPRRNTQGTGISGHTVRSSAQETLEKTRRAADEANLLVLRQALMRYSTEKGAYPIELEQLASEGYVQRAALKDSKGNPYTYNSQTGEINLAEEE